MVVPQVQLLWWEQTKNDKCMKILNYSYLGTRVNPQRVEVIYRITVLREGKRETYNVLYELGGLDKLKPCLIPWKLRPISVFKDHLSIEDVKPFLKQ